MYSTYLSSIMISDLDRAFRRVKKHRGKHASENGSTIPPMFTIFTRVIPIPATCSGRSSEHRSRITTCRNLFLDDEFDRQARVHEHPMKNHDMRKSNNTKAVSQ